MVEKSINTGIMESIQKYIEKISEHYKIEAKLIGLTWKIDTRIEPHPIITEDYESIAIPFVQEVINTGIKVV